MQSRRDDNGRQEESKSLSVRDGTDGRGRRSIGRERIDNASDRMENVRVRASYELRGRRLAVVRMTRHLLRTQYAQISYLNAFKRFRADASIETVRDGKYYIKRPIKKKISTTIFHNHSRTSKYV